MEHDHGEVSEAKCSYDVFLSFTGVDTRQTFTRKLYEALCGKGINTFMDDEELKRGDELGPTLLKAIEESRISVVVFSEHYACSSWCLDELLKIYECKKSKKQVVHPIFYKVDPSDVRHQRGSYGEAMTKHELRKDSKKVKKWRLALTEIANLKGDHLKVEHGRDESMFIDDLAREIFNKVSPKDLSKNEHIVARKRLVEEVKSLLDLESLRITCLLGIHGTGGIGKTTLAKAVYDSIYKQFESSSFLSDVRDTSNRKGLENLQESLLKDILEDSKISVKRKEEGIRIIASRLGRKRVLVVLDDVDNIEQMKYLVGGGDCFGDGSRIIITTRDTHLLDVCGVEKRYKVNELPYQECLELFCQSAFGKSCPDADYEVLSERAVRCCKGLPLALKVLGSHIFGKDLRGWEDALDKYEKSPHRDVQKVLRISYDSLDFNERNIFLDIACLFKSYSLEYVKSALDACDFNAGDGISTLVNKSLLTVDNRTCLEMHDLIQDMGREIVKEEANNRVGEYSRLWNYEDIIDVLASNKGSSKIQAIRLERRIYEYVGGFYTGFENMDNHTGFENMDNHTGFENMDNLRILIIRNSRFSKEPRYLPNNLRVLEWRDYPSQSLPSGFHLRKIGVINLSRCPLLVLGKSFQRFEHLTHLAISYCDMVTEFPDVSGAKKLKELKIEQCLNLVNIHESVGYLANLVSLRVDACPRLQSFVRTISLPSLEFLTFKNCLSLARFPEIEEVMDKPLKISISDAAIKDLPESINKLVGLNYLGLVDCEELQHLPSNLFMLPKLFTLQIFGCYKLRESFRRFERSQTECSKLETLCFEDSDLSDKDLQMIIYNFPNLKELHVRWNKFVSVPESIIECTKLASLDVRGCENLEEIPKLPPSVQKLDARECNSLTSETAGRLWVQVLTRFKRFQVMCPEREIPLWFDYVKKKGFPIFKARGMFPAVVVVFVFWKESSSKKKDQQDGISLMVEGEQRGFLPFNMKSNHMLVLDLGVLLSSKDAVVGLGNHWKTIQICCESSFAISSWGLHVRRRETNMDDINFTT